MKVRCEMVELTGKYNTAKVFTDQIDQESTKQIINLLDQPFCQGSKIRLMPDVHAGAGCTIGTTMTLTDKVVPNLVGVDIGCGMKVIQLREREIDLEKLDSVIREKVPSGFSIRDKGKELRYGVIGQLDWLVCRYHVDLERAARSIGTLGGGNHFIEVDKDDDGNLYLVIHTGSRHLGLEVAKYYQEKGYRKMTVLGCIQTEAVVSSLRRQGREREIEKTLKEMRKKINSSAQKDLAYVEGSLFEDYIHDMKIVQTFADVNRYAIADVITREMGLHAESCFTTTHNYIDTRTMILRKGAVSARKGEKLLIPMNMRDGSLLCLGKGNEDWNCSAPHGAGRLMSRAEAKRRFSVDEFKEQMEGIFTTSVGESTIDECPMAYKSMESIVENIGPTVEILNVIKPIYNFKAGED